MTVTAEELASRAVSDWFDDSIDFCYIYEQDCADGVGTEELQRAHKIALDIIDTLAQRFDDEV